MNKQTEKKSQWQPGQIVFTSFWSNQHQQFVPHQFRLTERQGGCWTGRVAGCSQDCTLLTRNLTAQVPERYLSFEDYDERDGFRQVRRNLSPEQLLLQESLTPDQLLAQFRSFHDVKLASKSELVQIAEHFGLGTANTVPWHNVLVAVWDKASALV